MTATVKCLAGCGWSHGPTTDVAAADLEARRHTGEGRLRGPGHATHLVVTP